MKSFVGERFGRYVIIGLEKGDLILESLEQVLKETGIRNAIVTSGVAAANHMRWHHVKDLGLPATNEIHEVDGPIEVGGFTGLVLDGVPHLHVNFSTQERAWSEHMEPGCQIQYVGEISLIELLDVDLTRDKNQFGARAIKEKEK